MKKGRNENKVLQGFGAGIRKKGIGNNVGIRLKDKGKMA